MPKRKRFRNGRRVKRRRKTTVLKSIPGELKFFDRDVDVSPIATAGSITNSINLVAQGVTEETRVGRKMTIVSIGWRFRMTMGPTTDEQATSDTARIIMYKDKQANGATATTADILEDADFQSFNNLSNSGRFMILMDRTYDVVIPSGGTSAAGVDQFGEVQVNDTFFRKTKIPIEFSDTAGAITEIRSNNVGLLLISASANVSFSSKLRIRFFDG